MPVPSSLPAIPFAAEALTLVVVATGAIVVAGIIVAAKWGAKQARTARAIAEGTGQLVCVRPIAGGDYTPLFVPRSLTSLFTAPVQLGELLPPWQSEVALAIDMLAVRVIASETQSATLDFEASGRRLRLIGALINEGTQLLVSLADAGPDVARVNRLESAALLSSGVAHDLLNVLNTLVLHAEVGHERAAVPAARTHFDRIRIGSLRAADLVTLMRRYLRGDSGIGAVGPVRVSAIVEEVVELLRPKLPRNLELPLALDADAIVMAEPVHVHQVVLNLVVNALQALEDRPSPRIAITVARVGTTEAGNDAVELIVADNGPGLPLELRERCFEPYVTTKTTGKTKGSGLGLAVVRALVVDTLGGAITIDDTPGGGARFAIRIPATIPPRPTPEVTDERTVAA